MSKYVTCKKCDKVCEEFDQLANQFQSRLCVLERQVACRHQFVWAGGGEDIDGAKSDFFRCWRCQMEYERSDLTPTEKAAKDSAFSAPGKVDDDSN